MGFSIEMPIGKSFFIYFQCGFGLFKQVDGVPMGGPLSCLNDIFLEDYEEKVVIKLSDGTVIRADWLKSRDDTWMIWEHSQDLFDEFLRKLNGIDLKIKWEAVFEGNGQLPFLDVLMVRNEDGSFTTTVYRKPTHSDRYLHNRWGAACGEREVIKRLMSTTRCTWKKRRRRKKHKMSDVKHNE